MPRRGHPETVGSRVHIRVESLALPVGSGFQPAAGLLPGVWPQSRRTPAKSRRQAESLAPQGRGLAYAQIQAAWMMRHAGAHFCVIGFPEDNAFRGHPMRILGAISFSLFLAAGLSAQHGGEPVLRGTVGSVVNPGGGGVHLILPGQNNRRVPAARGSNLIAYPVYIAGTYDSS